MSAFAISASARGTSAEGSGPPVRLARSASHPNSASSRRRSTYARAIGSRAAAPPNPPGGPASEGSASGTPRRTPSGADDGGADPGSAASASGSSPSLSQLWWIADVYDWKDTLIHSAAIPPLTSWPSDGVVRNPNPVSAFLVPLCPSG